MTRDNSMPFGDAAVDGLLYGILAGAAMAAYLLATGWLAGESPVVLLARFDPNRSSAIVGTLFHFAVSGVYGIAFGLVWRVFQRWLGGSVLTVLLGMVFGGFLWLVANFLLLPRANPALGEINSIQFAISHLIYGAVAGLMMSRKSRERSRG